MTKTLAIGMAALAGLSLTVSALRAGERDAQSIDPVTTQSIGGGFFPQGAIEGWKGEHFTILRIDWMERFSAERAMVEEWARAHPQGVDALHAAIESNPALADAIARRGALVSNIAAAREALSGNLVFYLY